MTYQRVMSRNRLGTGGYENDPTLRRLVVAEDLVAEMPMERQRDTFRMIAERTYEQLDAERQSRNHLLGDLRRLEADATDERAVCQYIAEKLHVDPDLVAAVLGEFLRW